MLGKLYIVATPIGNLEDITLRALSTLKMVDVILCEDTRVTGKLLAHFGVSKSMMSFHQHSTLSKVNDIKKLLHEGKNLALVTDAGTPGISDPGNLLIRDLVQDDDLRSVVISPIPGSSAVVAALSISGFSTDKFLFLGFPPHKNKRKKFFKEVADAEYTVVFYESSHRIKKCFEELSSVLAPDRQLCIGRELTKIFESVYRGTMGEILAMDVPDKGEFVLVVSRIHNE